MLNMFIKRHPLNWKKCKNIHRCDNVHPLEEQNRQKQNTENKTNKIANRQKDKKNEIRFTFYNI